MIPLFAIVLPVLLLFCGLAIDVGFLESKSVAMQSAADAASSSAELEAERGAGNSNWITVGQQTAALNGYTDGVDGTTVTVTRQPASGSYAGRNDAIAVTISKPLPTFFMHYLFPTKPVSVTSVALIPPCIYLTGAQSGLTLSGSGAAINAFCPAYINGSGQLGGGSTMNTAANNLTGGSSLSGNISPGPTPNVPVLADPLASIAQPVFTSCTVNNFIQNGGSIGLSSGVFCGGMTLRNATVTLAPGLYVITGGAHWTNTTITGTGVTLFFTSTPSSGFGQFIIDGNSHVTLFAPTDTSSNGVPGLLVFGDRQWIASGPQDFQILNATVAGDGIWYTTQTGIAVSNTQWTTSYYFALDTASLVVNNSNLTMAGDFSNLAAGNPFRPWGGVAE